MVGRATVATFALLTITCRLWPGQEVAGALHPKEHRILFQARNGLIYVPAQVNGKKVTLLLDTGAVLTTFSIEIGPTMKTDSKIKINMAKGSVAAFLVPVGFTLGEPDVKERHCSFHQTVVVGDFKFGEADGVIGLDVLSSFRAVTFDFQNSVVVLEDR